MRIRNLLGASVLAMAIATPAWAQTATSAAPQADNTAINDGTQDIVVTAQRQSQRLQNVPIAVSAFSAETLAAQQVRNTSDLQLTLPNVTFTNGNFTGSSFTIRGIGDLCVGVSCDSATAIHLNDAPLFNTRLFETEFVDLERVEVLRGPQGTLFGRNATSGVVNFITARPSFDAIGASGEFEYGNYNSFKVKGMLNVPLTDTLGVRVAGVYLNRDGFTENVYNNTRLDGRDLYSIRGSLRWQPTDTTTIDLVGSYFHERDNRLRIQKQQCQRDPTGVLGCLNNRRDDGVTNANSTFVGVLTSREFLATQGIPATFALGSIYGTDAYSGNVNLSDPRQVNTDSPSDYFAEETIIQARLQQELGGGLSLKIEGNYDYTGVDSSQDYNLSVQNRALYAPALANLQAAATGGYGPAFMTYFAPIAAAIIPNGPTGNLCTSQAEETGTGAYGGHRVCSSTPTDFDRSNAYNKAWSVEGIISSDWDGPFNFLLGGIYVNSHLTENSYYVNSFGIDYLAGVLGSFTTLGHKDALGNPAPLPPAYLGTPFYRNNTNDFRLKSYGIFGEAYYNLTPEVKLTLGLRYNHDEKDISARTSLASFLVPYGSTSAFSSPYVGTFDADPGRAGNQLFQIRNVAFSEFTGRAVLDWQITPDHLLYASYSRGYKSGGINPPLSPVFGVQETFDPEFVNAFEIGSKNTFGPLQLNITAFYYQYQALQLSRIVARTSVNDNVDANIYGIELESIIHPTRRLAINMNFSYLHTEVSSDKFLANPRDPGGGRSDAVIIKDITNGSNCAVVATTAGNAAGANNFVNFVNNAINAGIDVNQNGTVTDPVDIKPGAGLQPTTSFGTASGLASNGAFSICGVLQSYASAAGAAFGGVQVRNEGVAVNIRGNQLPQAPTYKFSAGVQYTASIGTDMTLVPRVDLAYTGDSYGNIFNGRINRINGYEQVNAQLQLNGANDRWYVRAFVQNLFNSQPVTGLYVTDQSSGLFTNIFTLDPRRYGVAVGFHF